MSRLSVEERNRLAEDAQREQLEHRLRLEREASQAEAAKAVLEGLRQGGKTSRQHAAEEHISHLNLMARGRWQSSIDSISVPWGSLTSRALEAVQQAVKAAVADTLATMLEQAEAELDAATAERDEIVRRGKL